MNTEALICSACPVDEGACPHCGTFWRREGEKQIGLRIRPNFQPVPISFFNPRAAMPIGVTPRPEQNQWTADLKAIGDNLLRLLGATYIGVMLAELLRWLGLFK
jgi:hypothetical protein